MATKHPLDGTEPSSNVGGRPPALKPEHIAILRDIVTERAQASLKEIADELHHRCGLRVCDATIRRTLRALGIVRLWQTKMHGSSGRFWPMTENSDLITSCRNQIGSEKVRT